MVYFVMKERAKNGVFELRVGEGKMGTFAWAFAMLIVGVLGRSRGPAMGHRKNSLGLCPPKGKGGISFFSP